MTRTIVIATGISLVALRVHHASSAQMGREGRWSAPISPKIRPLDLPDDGFGGLHPGLVAIVRLDHVPQPHAAAAERECHSEHQILASAGPWPADWQENNINGPPCQRAIQR